MLILVPPPHVEPRDRGRIGAPLRRALIWRKEAWPVPGEGLLACIVPD
jgi:hypothetical protein